MSVKFGSREEFESYLQDRLVLLKDTVKKALLQSGFTNVYHVTVMKDEIDSIMKILTELEEDKKDVPVIFEYKRKLRVPK